MSYFPAPIRLSDHPPIILPKLSSSMCQLGPGRGQSPAPRKWCAQRCQEPFDLIRRPLTSAHFFRRSSNLQPLLKTQNVWCPWMLQLWWLCVVFSCCSCRCSSHLFYHRHSNDEIHLFSYLHFFSVRERGADDDRCLVLFPFPYIAICWRTDGACACVNVISLPLHE